MGMNDWGSDPNPNLYRSFRCWFLHSRQVHWPCHWQPGLTKYYVSDSNRASPAPCSSSRQRVWVNLCRLRTFKRRGRTSVHQYSDRSSLMYSYHVYNYCLPLVWHCYITVVLPDMVIGLTAEVSAQITWQRRLSASRPSRRAIYCITPSVIIC